MGRLCKWVALTCPLSLSLFRRNPCWRPALGEGWSPLHTLSALQSRALQSPCKLAQSSLVPFFRGALTQARHPQRHQPLLHVTREENGSPFRNAHHPLAARWWLCDARSYSAHATRPRPTVPGRLLAHALTEDAPSSNDDLAPGNASPDPLPICSYAINHE